MPTLDQKAEEDLCKMLFVGDSGAGKSGAVASLVDAGYRIWALDFDNGLQPIIGYTKKKANLANFHYIDCTDEIKINASGMLTAPKGINGLKRAMGALDKWPEEPGGSLFDRGPDDILLLDSLTFAGKGALRLVQSLRGNLHDNATQPQWGDAMRLTENILMQLYSERVKCHVIVTSHITTLEDEETGKVLGRYPSALGKKLPPQIPRYFNTMVRARTKGQGDSAKKVIETRSRDFLELKVPTPTIPAELPLEDGLRTIFKAIRGREPGTAA